MKVFSSILSWIRLHFDKKKVNHFSIVIVMIYYYIGLLSYITNPIKPLYSLFVSSSSVSVVVRAFLSAIVCLYSLLVVIVNDKKVQWKWSIAFIYILLFTLISTAISPQKYTYIYITKLYSVVHKVEVEPGLSRIAIMFFSSISDFALAFCFLFILPIVINEKKQLLFLLIPIAIIGIFECAYSLVVEKDEYILLIQTVGSDYGGYQINIGASFGNKQDWGAFAAVAFASAAFSIILLDGKGIWSFIVKIVLAIFTVILFVFTVASLCKTAIISELFLLIFLIIIIEVKLKKSSKIFFAISLSLALLVICGLVAVVITPSFQNLPYIGPVFQMIHSYIIKNVSLNSLWGRTSLWYYTISNLRTYNLFFGLSKAGVNAFSQVIIVEGQTTLHNGFVYFLLSYGIMGFAIYFLLLAIVVKRLLNLTKIDYRIGLCLLGCFGCSLIFTLVESEVFIVSGSNPIFIYNILLCSFSMGYIDKERRFCGE